ncbi:UDP-N-acetylmuramoyl-L-alanine--D-glutamate ligase [Candidatus Parcubacteria bacterium]|nr:UDP-N-acetylmuramoyl-L-alanine--D-glutamate ligase [Candidatus Parcubacteria bacterium]
MDSVAKLKNKRVLIMGLGLHGGGVGAARFFVGTGARVTVTDLRTAKELAPSLHTLQGLGIKYVLGRHRERDFHKADLVIQNPGVPNSSPYLAAARKAGVPIDTDVGVFAVLCPAPTIGITGTKGKSTTATLIAECLRRTYRDVVLAGNIRTSVLEVLPRIRATSKVVLELSSWQLEGLERKRYAPHIAVITNIFPEHLNRYPSFAAYIRAKALITRFQTASDHLFLKRGDAMARKAVSKTKAAMHFWSSQDRLPSGVSLLGEHNRANLRAAQAVARFLGVPNRDIIRVFRRFRGLAGRLEVVRRVGGVTFVNDTTATMPQAAIAAIRSMPIAPVVIAGGADKNLDYRGLAETLRRKTKAFILLKGTATDKIKAALGGEAPETDSMSAAVRFACSKAKRGDFVLLSPGAASFGLFRHEFDRGEKFVAAVRRLRR